MHILHFIGNYPSRRKWKVYEHKKQILSLMQLMQATRTKSRIGITFLIIIGAASPVPSNGNTLALMIAKCAIFMETGLAAIFRTVTVTEPSTVHHISDARLITKRPL